MTHAGGLDVGDEFARILGARLDGGNVLFAAQTDGLADLLVVQTLGRGEEVTLMVPIPPALHTAAASCGTASHCMPLWTIGYSMPNISVSFVFMYATS